MIARTFAMRAALSDAARAGIAYTSDRESSEEIGPELLATTFRTPHKTG